MMRAYALILLACLASNLRADDWPQWLGPKRDGVWRESGLIDKFPEAGPKVRWRVPVRGGYAGPAVAQGKVFVTDFQQIPGTAGPKDAWDRKARTGTERVLCFNEADGKQLWAHEYEVNYTISYGSGPRATPIVEGNRVYVLGAEGHVHCLDVETGKQVWVQRGTTDNAATPTWGFSGHPLLDGDKLIVLTAGQAVTAFNKTTGDVLWKSLQVKEPGYAPPMIFTLGGKRTLILWHPASVNGLDPETGKVLWTNPLGPVRNGVSIATPLVELTKDWKTPLSSDKLFITSAYTGGLMLGFSPGSEKPEVAWHQVRREGSRRGDALHTLMAAPVFYDGHLYGVDFQGQLVCIDAANGSRKWETLVPVLGPNSEEGRTWATAFLTPTTDGKFFIANDQGDLIIAKLTPQGYTELSRTHLLTPTNKDANVPVVWCAPAYANRSIYWRNDNELICVSLAADAR